MSRLPRINPEDLRDHADEARIDRIWRKVQRDLPGATVVGAVPVSGGRPARRVGRLVLVAACLGGVFGAGLLIGSKQLQLSTSEGPEVAAVDSPLSDVFAAGTRQRTFALPGGGRLILQPESLVEVVEVRDGSVRLHLLQGRASVDASMADMSFAVVAGEALTLAPAGSVVSLSRLDTDVDVAVDQGSVEVLSPAGRRVVGRGETSRVPIVASVSSADDARSPQVVATQPPHHPSDDGAEPDSERSPAKVASTEAEAAATAPAPADAAPSWLALFEKDNLKDASRVLEERGGISAAITSAQSVRELMALWEIAADKKRTDLAIAALRRVADDFPSDPNSPAAAKMLADAYERMGQTDLATTYRNKAMQSGRLSETLLCRQLSDAPNPAEARRVAAEYLQRFPDGTCADDAKDALAEAPAEGEPKPEEEKDGGAEKGPSEKPSEKSSDSASSKDQKAGAPQKPGAGEPKQ
ncbi:MAG: hypothetical protein JNL21_02785 [Myxococcales bacterium]|nr:hypothetical protein [Myxococcales bacterium]